MEKFNRRQATVTEVEAIGFTVEDFGAKSPKTGAWYSLEDFCVSSSATVNGEQRFGQFLYLESGLPMQEHLFFNLDNLGEIL